MRTLILAAIAALMTINSAIAEDHFYVGSSLTYQYWDEARFLPGLADDNSSLLGGAIGYEFGNIYAVELAALTNLSDTDSTGLELVLYNFFSDDREGITPYLVSGISRVDLDDSVAILDETYNGIVGIGFSNYLSEFMEFKADIRLQGLLNDHYPGGKVLDAGLRASLNYHFGSVGSSTAAAPAPAQPAPVERMPAPEPQRAAPPPAPAPAMQMPARTITVELEVLFEYNSAEVAEAGAEMAQMAAALNSQSDLTLTLEGHTDSDGGEAYNLLLSQRRVDAVKAELVEAYGAPADRIQAVGYGETRPIADNATAEGRAQNRRVVGVISFEAAQ